MDDSPPNDDVIALRKAVADAMHNKAYLLGNLGRPEEAIQTYNSLLKFVAVHPEAEDDYGLSLAMSNKAILEGESGDPTAALETCNELIARFADNADVLAAEQVARAYHDRGVALKKLGREPESMRSYSDLIEMFSSSDNVDIQLQVLQAMIGQAFRLEDDNDITGAMSKLRVAVNKFKDSADPRIRQRVAKALFNLARFESSQGRYADAGVHVKHLQILGEGGDEKISSLARLASKFEKPEPLSEDPPDISMEEAQEASKDENLSQDEPS